VGLISRAYPTSAAELALAIPGATFTHGWLCDELSGDLLPVFGGVTLTASGTGLIYGDPGPRGANDRCVGFTTGAATGRFSGNAALFDIASNTDELVVAWVGRWNAKPTAFGGMFGKASAAFGNGWHINGNDGTSISFGLGPGSTYSPSSIAGFYIGEWHVGIAVVDRSGTDTARFGVRELTGTNKVVSSSATGINGNAASSGSNFTVGRGDWVPGNDNFRLAALYVGKGAGVAAGLAPNVPALLDSFADRIAYGPTVRDYTRMLFSLLPPGKAWRFLSSLVTSVVAASADEIGRLHERVLDLLEESDPSTATELLPEYEQDLELVAAATVTERRANITAHRTALQGFRPEDLRQALAPLLGQAAVDVVVIERSLAFIATIGDQREIFRFSVYRNPALPGTYFLANAQALLDEIQPSHTQGKVIESVSVLCDDPFSLVDRDLLGV
jgi:hypothetical protein